MSYESFLEKPSSSKVVLVEVTIGEEYSGVWTNVGPGVWASRVYFDKEVSTNFTTNGFGHGVYGTGSDEQINIGDARKNVGSVFIDQSFYIKVNSQEQLIQVEDSYLWDSAEQVVYIHFQNSIVDPNFTVTPIIIGFVENYSSKAGVYNDFYYDPRVKSVPTIKHSRDPLYFGVISFEGGSVLLENMDSELDNLYRRDFYGQEVTIRYGEEGSAYEDFDILYIGFIENINYVGTDVNVKIMDKRKSLTRKLPIQSYTKAAYPYLDDSDVGQPIPFAYGVIKQAKPICINMAQSTSIYTFKVADTTYRSIKAINAVYIDDKPVGFGGVNLSNGTFTLTSSVYEANDKVTVDFQGYANDEGGLLSNPLDMIIDWLEEFGGIIYNDVFFNITEWDYARGLVPDVGIVFTNTKTLIDAIGDVCRSVLGFFIRQDDGLFTFKLSQYPPSPVKTIKISDMSQPPKISFKSQEFITSVVVKYSEKKGTGHWFRYVDKSRQAEIFKRYRIYKEREFETLLTSEAAATTFASNVLDLFEVIKPIYTIKSFQQHFDLGIGEVVDVELFQSTSGEYGTARGEVVGVLRDVTKSESTINVRLIEELADPIDLYNLVKWDMSRPYVVGQVAAASGTFWRALQPSEGMQPVFSSDFWEAVPLPQHEWSGTELRFENPDGSWGLFVDLEGPQGIQGPIGPEGPIGPRPDHEWGGTQLRFENVDGSWGPYVDLEGPQGPQGDAGPGLVNRGQWVSGTIYDPNDYVFDDSSADATINAIWVVQAATSFVSNTQPKNDLTNWAELAGPEGPQGDTGPAPAHQWDTTQLRFQNPNGTWGAYTDLEGPQGIQGIQGDEGPQGPTGSIGPEGPAGIAAVWSSATTYGARDFVTYGTSIYESLQGSNLNQQPDISPSYWRQWIYQKIWYSTVAPSAGSLQEGDMWFTYE